MQQIQGKLEKRKEELLKIKKQKLEEIKKGPQGTLRISISEGKIRYYHRTNSKDFNGVYIKESDKELANKLAQKDYDKKVLKEIEKELVATERYLHTTKLLNTNRIYENLHKERQRLVTPIWVPNQKFVEQWEAVEYTGKEFAEQMPEIYTSKGERVRSKSEVMIADLLREEEIPYRYEYPIYLKGVGMIYPDFTILNKTSRKEIYWEHLGMMDDSSYAENAIRKIISYEQNGIFPGQELILTYETKMNPLTPKMIKMLIAHYLK